MEIFIFYDGAECKGLFVHKYITLIDKTGGNINLLNYFFPATFVYWMYDKSTWVYIIFLMLNFSGGFVIAAVCVDQWFYLLIICFGFSFS